MLKLTPIFSTKPRYTLKLPDIVCHYDQSATSRMACNHLIIRANRSSFPGKLGTNLPAMNCCECVIVQNLKSGHKSLDYGQIPFWSLTFLSTIDQLHQSDRADTHSGCVEVKAFSDKFRFVFNSKNADVGIKHEFQHQKPSRSCSAGCSLPLIKSLTIKPAIPGLSGWGNKSAFTNCNDFNLFYAFRKRDCFWESDCLGSVTKK